jgi:hypothetical protein
MIVDERMRETCRGGPVVAGAKRANEDRPPPIVPVAVSREAAPTGSGGSASSSRAGTFGAQPIHCSTTRPSLNRKIVRASQSSG